MIFGYLSFFRLEELAIEDYKKLVCSQDAVKMNVFLQFVFNTDNLRQFVREEWMTLYDYAYIDEKIIGAIEKNLPNVAPILKKVEIRATGKATSMLSQSTAEDAKRGESWQSEEPQKKRPTEQQPFNLTKPKPKVIPQPEPIKKEVKANPVPKNLFKKTLADFEKEKEERRQEKIK